MKAYILAQAAVGSAQKMREALHKTPAKTPLSTSQKVPEKPRNFQLESPDNTASYYLVNSPTLAMSRPAAVGKEGEAADIIMSMPAAGKNSALALASSSASWKLSRSVLKTAHPHVCAAVSNELKRIRVRGNKFAALSKESALRLGQCQQLLKFLRDQTQLSNSDILVEMRSTRLQVSRLQRDVQVLREELNGAEIDRDNLSLGLRLTTLHHDRARQRTCLFVACMAMRNNAAPARRAKRAAGANTRSPELEQTFQSWSELACRRRVGFLFASSLARKARVHKGTSALAAWRLAVAFRLQESAYGTYMTTERERERNFAALHAQRRNLVRHFYSILHEWFQVARDEKCFRKLCSLSVPAAENAVQCRIVIKRGAWSCDDKQLKRQLRRDIASFVAQMHTGKRKGLSLPEPTLVASIQDQIHIGQLQKMWGPAAEDYVENFREELRKETLVSQHFHPQLDLRKREVAETLQNKKRADASEELLQRASTGKDSLQIVVIDVAYQAFTAGDVSPAAIVNYLHKQIDIRRPVGSSMRDSKDGYVLPKEPMLELSSRANLTAHILAQKQTPASEMAMLARVVPRWHYHLECRCFRDWVSKARGSTARVSVAILMATRLIARAFQGLKQLTLLLRERRAAVWRCAAASEEEVVAGMVHRVLIVWRQEAISAKMQVLKMKVLSLEEADSDLTRENQR